MNDQIYDNDCPCESCESLKTREARYQQNNPDNKPTGAYTGRCSNCGSNDLWDDASMYGCNSCNAMFSN